MYEVVSETNFKFSSDKSFCPNYFVNIENFINKKITAISKYKTEIAKFPFPRSQENIMSLSIYRGSFCGFKYAEAFQLVYERLDD